MKAEMQKTEMVEDDFNDDQKAVSAELYDILTQLCRGQGLTLIRAVPDYEGMQRLQRKYNPKTVARLIKVLGKAAGPAKILEIKDLETRLNKWEEDMRYMEKHSGENWSENLKIAIMTNMMPSNVQEFLCTNIGEGTTYKEATEKLRIMISNKVEMQDSSIAMDLGNVNKNESLGGGDHHQEEWLHEQWQDVDAVGFHVKCHTCGEGGHLARECTSKGVRAVPRVASVRVAKATLTAKVDKHMEEKDMEAKTMVKDLEVKIMVKDLEVKTMVKDLEVKNMVKDLDLEVKIMVKVKVKVKAIKVSVSIATR